MPCISDMIFKWQNAVAFVPAVTFGTKRNGAHFVASGGPMRDVLPCTKRSGRISTRSAEAASFFGARLRPVAASLSTGPRMAVDPWSVSPEFLDVVAAQSFAASLFPYLGFLFFLGKKETDCPKLANFGFQFLLAFVGATIPAGIWAKVHYGTILANVDWLHGSAESLLTITNLLIVLGFRQAFMAAAEKSGSSFAQYSTSQTSKWNPALLGGAGLAALASTPLLFPGTHAEPANALTFATWIIHISSLFEWLAAMGLVWNYADLTGNSRWRGLTWGMLPLHTSGLCACTYHMFYNAPSLNILVAIQAALTFFGNGTMCWAAYRIFQNASESGASVSEPKSTSPEEEVTVARNPVGISFDPQPVFLWKLVFASALGSAVVKWGELYFDGPFEPSLAAAMAFILIPSGLNVLKWTVRSNETLSSFAKFL